MREKEILGVKKSKIGVKKGYIFLAGEMVIGYRPTWIVMNANNC